MGSSDRLQGYFDAYIYVYVHNKLTLKAGMMAFDVSLCTHKMKIIKKKKDSRVLLKHIYICTQQTHPESWDGGV